MKGMGKGTHTFRLPQHLPQTLLNKLIPLNILAIPPLTPRRPPRLLPLPSTTIPILFRSTSCGTAFQPPSRLLNALQILDHSFRAQIHLLQLPKPSRHAHVAVRLGRGRFDKAACSCSRLYALRLRRRRSRRVGVPATGLALARRERRDDG